MVRLTLTKSVSNNFLLAVMDSEDMKFEISLLREAKEPRQ